MASKKISEVIKQIEQLGISKPSPRATFYMPDQSKPIRAGGVLLVHPDLGWLMQEKILSGKKQYSDFGGKTDKQDYDIYHTISRELSEETNNLITIPAQDLKKGKQIYISSSKYLLIIINTDSDFEMEIASMGDTEIHNGKPRLVKFIKNIDSTTLHPRIKNFWFKKKPKAKRRNRKNKKI